ncbi:hypothetical protein ACWEF6_02855 [Amycolatopsis sp. NPDC004772]
MRIRSTKPEFWRSERVASVNWDARLVLKGLESYVDDNGVGKDDLALIVADVFPRDLSRNPTGTLQKVSEALTQLSEAGLLWRYEVEGTKLLYIAFWESIQRIEKPTKGRFPRPDGTMNYRDSEIREDSRNPPGTLPEPSGLEQGNRGTGEQGNTLAPPSDAVILAMPTSAPASPKYPEAFEQAWAAYGRKGAKKTAYAEWQRVAKRADLQVVVAAIPAYVKATPDLKFRKDFERWLKGDCWESAVVPQRTGSGYTAYQDPDDLSGYYEDL